MNLYFTLGRQPSWIFEKCSSMNPIYMTDYVYGSPQTSKSVETKLYQSSQGSALKSSMATRLLRMLLA